MTRYSSERKPETRARILRAADRVMKDKGVASASVDAVMREAGLTVGGFYAHFPSKDALAQEALLAGLEASVGRLLVHLAPVPDGAPWVRALIGAYLAQADDPALAHACPLTLFLPDVARGSREFKNAFAERTGTLLDRIAAHFPEVPGMTKRQAALAVYSACVGAVVLARAVAAPEARARILATTQALLERALALPEARSRDPRPPAPRAS